MSSLDVRQAIEAAVIAAAAPAPVFDLSDYVTLEDCLKEVDDEAVLIQYVIADEVFASIGARGSQGWEQTGTITLHYVVPTGFDSTDTVSKCDQIREALRGQRLTEKITVESCEPFTDFGAGATGLYGGPWHGWASNLFYRRRDCG